MKNNIYKIFKDNSIDFISLSGNEEKWDQASNLLNYLPVEYSNHWIKYQTEYFSSQNDTFVDCSILLLWDNKLCGILPISIHKDNSNYILKSHSSKMLPPLFIKNFSKKSSLKIIQKIYTSFNIFCKQNNIDKIEFTETQYNNGNISLWHELLINNEMQIDIEYEIFVNLNFSIQEIKSSFRESYKSLISSSQKIWSNYILESFDINIWNEFKNLHFDVSGKKTRNDKTWDIQHDSLVKKHSILIYLRDCNNLMIGGGFFDFTNDEAVYSVGVYKRELFDKPIGHLVQMLAIEYFKSKGVRMYKIGTYTFNQKKHTKKEISISHFKKGFSNCLLPKFIFSKSF